MILRSTFPLLLLVTCVSFSHAQNDSLIHSGYHLRMAKVLSDSGAYVKAIRELQIIDARDTNYVQGLTDLASTYYSNKQYEDAIAIADKALLIPSTLRSQLLTTQGMSYTELKQYEKAKAIFEGGLKDFPFNASLLIQYGKMLYSQKHYDEAEKYFFLAMRFYPFNLTSHLYLAFISMQRGEKTRGMMSMGIYMALNNSANNHLVTLERFVKNELTDEFSIPPTKDNPFARLDEIIRSRIAMDDRYITKIPSGIGIVKQYQLLFEQLAAQEFVSNDAWTTSYLPIYKTLIKENGQEAFIYHILKSTTIKIVPEWTKKNEKVLQQFYATMNKAIPVMRVKQTLPESWGFREPVSAWFANNNRLESIGQVNNKDENIGQWYFFNENGSIKAKGLYDDHGKKVGFWRYYSALGIQSGTENFETGEVVRYDERGFIRQKYFLKNGRMEGELFNYFPCGNVKEHLMLKNGLREGPAEVYSIDGTILEKMNFVKDSIQGTYQTYFDTGELRQKSTFERGRRNKTFTSFHQNGKIFSQGDYVFGNGEGPWKSYHDNGQVKEDGQYKEDLPMGKFTFYDRNGVLIETRNYNDQGQLHGENVYYHDGKIHYRLNYRNAIIVGVTYYDRKGAVIASYENDKGTFACKGYYHTGELRSEFQYQEGEPVGTWNYYYRAGNLESTHEYNKVLHGKTVEYYPNKMIKSVVNYKDGELDGKYEGFTEVGQLRVRGWYQFGQLQQQWTSYYSNGKIKTDEYYLNGVLTGSSYNYDPDGKVIFRTDYQDGSTVGLQYFNEEGAPNSAMTASKGGRSTMSMPYKSGMDAITIELLCGKYHGKVVTNLPDGKPMMVKSFVNDKPSGKYEKYFVDGKLETAGKYQDGNNITTSWYYPTKTIDQTGRYVEDERDSTWTYYHANGKVSHLSPYQNGKRHGTLQVFSPEGQLILEKLFDEGDLIAYRTAVSKDTAWIAFKGTGTIRANFPSGKLAYEESFLNGELNGQRRAFYANGALLSQENFVNGTSEGVSVENSANGKTRIKKSYKVDEPNGRWEYYNGDGVLERVENYSFGLLHGSTEFFSNGKKVRHIRFWYGIPTE